MSKKDEEVRVINRLYDQATKYGEGEWWYNRFLHYIKRGQNPLKAAMRATRENITLNTLNEKRRL